MHGPLIVIGISLATVLGSSSAGHAELGARELVSNKTGTERDVLLAVMKDKNGNKSLHKQLVKSQDCRKLLEEFAKSKRKSEPFTLRFGDPDFVGHALDLYCIRPDGKIIGPPAN